MPIGYPPASGGGGISDVLAVSLPNVVAGELLFDGQVIALVDVAGTKTLLLCGAREVDYAFQFIGFASADFAIGENHPIITGRGSRVEPLLDGGGALTPNELLYLSLTPGFVTHTAPQGSGIVNTPIGYAVSTTEMILKTDSRVVFP